MARLAEAFFGIGIVPLFHQLHTLLVHSGRVPLGFHFSDVGYGGFRELAQDIHSVFESKNMTFFSFSETLNHNVLGLMWIPIARIRGDRRELKIAAFNRAD